MFLRLKYKIFAALVVIALFSLWSPAPRWATAQSATVASSRDGEECSFRAIYENDQLWTDRSYTTGVLLTKSCISAVMSKDDPTWRFPHIWNKAIAEWLQISDRKPYVGESAYALLSLYTPNELEEPTNETDGRPYASLFIYGDSIVFADHTGPNRAFKQGIQLGLLGMPWAGSIQSEVHRMVDAKIPQGWSSQISDGGEPTFLYSAQETWLLRGAPDGDTNFDMAATLGGALGYYTAVQGKLTVRLGWIDTPFWVTTGPIADETFQPERANGGWQGAATKSRNSEGGADQSLNRLMPSQAYLVFTAGGSVVLYNALLQGQFRDNGYEVPASKVERVVGNAVVGLVLQFGRFQASYSHSYREREIRGGRSHRWNSLSLRLFY